MADKEFEDFMKDYNNGVYDNQPAVATNQTKTLTIPDAQFNFCCSLGLARHKQGLTQAQLAQIVGTTQSVIARLERGRGNPNLQLILKICQQLRVTIQAI